MFEHRSTDRYTSAQMLCWLAWLPRAMRARGQSEFHLGRPQRNWPPTKAQQWVAALVPAIVVGLFVEHFADMDTARRGAPVTHV